MIGANTAIYRFDGTNVTNVSSQTYSNSPRWQSADRAGVVMNNGTEVPGSVSKRISVCRFDRLADQRDNPVPRQLPDHGGLRRPDKPLPLHRSLVDGDLPVCRRAGTSLHH